MFHYLLNYSLPVLMCNCVNHVVHDICMSFSFVFVYCSSGKIIGKKYINIASID